MFTVFARGSKPFFVWRQCLAFSETPGLTPAVPALACLAVQAAGGVWLARRISEGLRP